MNQLFSYSKCSTCRKAISWLRENNIAFDLFDIVEQTPSRSILIKAIESLENRKKIFNTSGKSYREQGASRFNQMSDSQVLDSLVADGKLIKRPLFVGEENKILVGFNPDAWAEKLLH